jgi:hypothetical protein
VMAAPIPLCSACETKLNRIEGKWVCLRSGYQREGQTQTIRPRPEPSRQERLATAEVGSR